MNMRQPTNQGQSGPPVDGASYTNISVCCILMEIIVCDEMFMYQDVKWYQ